MKQSSFSQAGFASKKKKTRREIFLEQLNASVPWSTLPAVIEPIYPSGIRGRPPPGLERMLRMYVMQQCLGLSDEGTEDTLYDSQAAHNFVGIDWCCDAVPDATTLLKFRHQLEAHKKTHALFDAVKAHCPSPQPLSRKGRGASPAQPAARVRQQKVIVKAKQSP